MTVVVAGLLAVVAVAVMGGVGVWWARGQFKLLTRKMDETRALVALEASGHQRQALPWSEWSLSPDSILALLSYLPSGRTSHVVECGAGLSTVYVAQHLRALGKGHLWSVEHDPVWAMRVRRWLEERHLAAWATVVDAPLKDGWYDPDVLRDMLNDAAPIDLLTVDGPPAAVAKEARYPALPYFDSALAAHATVVLDDGHRPDETRIARRWSEQGWTRHLVRTRAGLWVLRREASRRAGMSPEVVRETPNTVQVTAMPAHSSGARRAS
jgi:predicted O-methyltransferase YrrM